MGKISKNELSESLATRIEEIDLKANISDLETTNSQLAQKVNKTSDTMTGNLNVPTINSKTPAYAITPQITTISSGFVSGWSGSYKFWKNQENIKFYNFFYFTKTTDILEEEIIYTLPYEQRPSEDVLVAGLGFTGAGGLIKNTLVVLRISTDGKVRLYNVGGVTANVKTIVGMLAFEL